MPERGGDNPVSLTDPPALAPDSVWSLAAFWLTTFASAALAAAVLLAPRWEQRESLQNRVVTLADQCRELNQRNERLIQVMDALKHDADFNAELARYELGYGDPDEERLPASSPTWPLNAARFRSDSPPRPSKPPTLSDMCVGLFARDTLVRRTALLTAAIFAIVSVVYFRTEN